MTTFISTQATGVPDTVAATGVAAYAWLLILIPLASAGLLLALGRVSDKWGHLLATLASWSTFAVGAAIAAQMWNSPVGARRFGETLFTWIPAGDFTVDFGLLVDPLSITFVILVTFVGSLIHVYAIAYMEHDEARRRFFAYLNFFIAAMLTIVGYSINNTIIIFDRIRENARKMPSSTPRVDVVNRSIKECLGRTINTTLTTLVTIVCLYIFGVSSIREFALPIIVGIISGVYSANMINGYVWAFLEEKKRAKKAAKA